jgi:Tat protein secretion system quality control protein TatD with DNase activity
MLLRSLVLRRLILIAKLWIGGKILADLMLGNTRTIAHDCIACSKEHKVVPAFGWHPWFSHQMFDESEYDGATTLTPEQKAAHYQSVLTPKSDDSDFLLSLPDARPFGEFIAQMRHHLEKFPLALVGEVGLDKSFRIPEDWLPQHLDERNSALTPGGREGRRLSPYRVSMDHQRKVLLAQLRLAGEMRRAVSVHGVQAHGIVHNTLAETWKGHERKPMSRKEKKKKAEAAQKIHAEPEGAESEGENSGPQPYPPRICLHSFSGPAETVKLYTAPTVPCEVFFSFSTTINSWVEDGQGKVEAAVGAVPDDRLLMESDLHTAGDRMDQYLEEIVRKLCEVKGWDLETGTKQLAANWRRFVAGKARS